MRIQLTLLFLCLANCESVREKRDAEADPNPEPVVLFESDGGKTASLIHKDSGLQYQVKDDKVCTLR